MLDIYEPSIFDAVDFESEIFNLKTQIQETKK